MNVLVVVPDESDAQTRQARIFGHNFGYRVFDTLNISMCLGLTPRRLRSGVSLYFHFDDHRQ
jgi:hypothetical protein